MEGEYINTMKTTFDLNFDQNQAVEQYGYTYMSRELIFSKSSSLIACKIAIRKKC